MKARRVKPPSPALVIATIALVVAMSGSVYAARQAKINGRAIKVKSLPGNRLKPKSVPANRLAPSVLAAIPTAAAGAPGVITGLEIDEMSLGEVPEAAHAQVADRAANATQAETALNAVNAVNASKVNGYEAGCLPGTQYFAGECWQSSAAETAVPAAAAAQSCAAQGGRLPETLGLAAYAQQATLDPGDEWTSDITNVSGPDLYGVLTVSSAGEVDYLLGTFQRKYRCVFPLLR